MVTPVLKIDPKQKEKLDKGFAGIFGGEPSRYFSAPGRTEIGGNHTDHQRGRVLAAAVNLDTVAAVRPNETDKIRILSEGYPMCEIDLNDLVPDEKEFNTTPALVRGVAARFVELGCEVKGFDAYCESTVLPGSGLLPPLLMKFLSEPSSIISISTQKFPRQKLHRSANTPKTFSSENPVALWTRPLPQ